MSQDTSSHYVDNVRFQELLVARRKKFEETGVVAQVAEELAIMLLNISVNLSYRRNFINYSFREEMIGDGIENCIKCVDRYDPENYSNPFGYFTQTCFYAFLRRILREEKQSIAKNAIHERQLSENLAKDPWDFQNSVVDDYMRGQEKHDLTHS